MKVARLQEEEQEDWTSATCAGEQNSAIPCCTAACPHQMGNMVEWWYRCKNEICESFLRSAKKIYMVVPFRGIEIQPPNSPLHARHPLPPEHTVSRNSMHLEK